MKTIEPVFEVLETQQHPRCLFIKSMEGTRYKFLLKGNEDLRKVIKFLPIGNIVLETDCPYLSPVPNRGKRNDSSNLIYVAENIAKIKGLTVQEVIEATTENAKRLYNIK